MSQEVKVPDLGEDVEGSILEIKVKVGDKVNKDTIVAVVNTDKVDADVPAELEGEVEAIKLSKGDKAIKGAVILTLKAATSATLTPPIVPTVAPLAAAPAPAASSLIDVVVPDLGEVSSGTLTEWLVKVGDVVKKDTGVAAINLDKADAEVPADAEGIVVEILVKAGSTVVVGEILMRINSVAVAAVIAPTAPTPPAPVQAAAAAVVAAPKAIQSASNGMVRISPLARKLARELNVDLAKVKATGERIHKLDVIEFYKNQSAPATGGGGFKQKTLPDFAKFGAIRKEKMSRINELTAENMSYAWSTIPHAWILEKVDITALEALRNQNKEAVKAKGASLTITALIAKAVARALHQFPTFNASIDMEAKEIIYKDYFHMGIAVDTPKGLLVATIRDCDKKSIFEIAESLTHISKDAKEGKAIDMSGQTFTISNVGGIGGSGILPIVNAPQAAILGVTSASQEAVWNGSNFEPRLMMQMTIGFDHRIINGADATRFLVVVKKMLENPFEMLLW